MPAPKNSLKAGLAEGRVQHGVWVGLATPAAAEIAAGAGFDWVLIDGEHAPNDIPLILAQLQAMGGAAASPVVRIPVGDARIIKQVLDLGVQTVLVPMVDTPEEAAYLARAMRYPPEGFRGTGARLARASGYGAIPDYLTTANDEVCLILQAESRKALENIDAIAATEGVDCVFIGPSDLAIDMGFPGQTGAPEVVAAIDDAIARIRAAGKAAGILTYDLEVAARYTAQGATFVGLGADVSILSDALRDLAARAKAD